MCCINCIQTLYSTLPYLSQKKMLPFISEFECYVGNYDDTKEDMDYNQAGLICPYCGHCSALRMEDDTIVSVEDALNCGDKKYSGWFKASTPQYRWIQAILNNVVYSHNEPPEVGRMETHFSIPGLQDEVWLYWDRGHAVAFCTLKMCGNPVPGSFMETYAMDVVDTVFVRKSHRGMGIAEKILTILFSRCDQNNQTSARTNEMGLCSPLSDGEMGLSSPLSDGMLLLVLKMLKLMEDWRWRTWLVTGDGGEGDKFNIWISGKEEMRKRGISQ